MDVMSITHKDSLADLVEKVGNSIVRIDAGHAWSGTGTVWSKGVVVTAHHVVDRDEGIELGLPDGSTVAATLAGRDPGTDLAVLKTEAALEPLAFRDLDGLRVGDFTVAVARPGRTARATFGIVSALGRDVWRTAHGGRIDAYLEPDLSMPPGFSGGPLVDLEGKALGVNSRGLSRRSHLSVPRATVERVVGELLAHGKVRRGYLGVGVHAVKLPAPDEGGVLVHAVEDGGAAQKAGILIGDAIVSLDGAKIHSPWDLASALQTKVDVDVKLEIIRAGNKQSLSARV
jgi:S1-C subfamily serine protease